MIIHIDNWESVSRKLILSFHILFHTPKILYRYILFFLKKRELKLHSFTCTANYCIDGTLNQLQWNVENALFIMLDNSSKIYFNPGNHIFKVSRDKNRYELNCYGVGKRINANTQLKIIELEPNDFNGIFPKDRQVALKKNLFQMDIKSLKLGENMLGPKPIWTLSKIIHPTIPMTVNADGKASNHLSKIQKAKTPQELKDLKELFN